MIPQEVADIAEIIQAGFYPGDDDDENHNHCVNVAYEVWLYLQDKKRVSEGN